MPWRHYELLPEFMDSNLRTILSNLFSIVYFSALVSFAYNVKGWRTSTLIAKLNGRDYAGAAAEFPRWCAPGSGVERGLRIRRLLEQALFLKA